jgi:hypothetical protein
MAAYVIPIVFLAAVIGVSVGIGYLCLEFAVRMIGRGLRVGLPKVRRPIYPMRGQKVIQFSRRGYGRLS